jgi:hypothetical protein
MTTIKNRAIKRHVTNTRDTRLDTLFFWAIGSTKKYIEDILATRVEIFFFFLNFQIKSFWANMVGKMLGDIGKARKNKF